MRDRIWAELRKAKFNQIYCELSLDYYRNWSNFYNGLVSVFSSGGAIMGLGFWKSGPIFPGIACALIAIIQCLKLLMPRIVPSDKQLKKVDSIVEFYLKYYLDLENIWFGFESKTLNEVDANTKLAKLKLSEVNIISNVNEIIRHNNKKINTKASAETKIYLTNNVIKHQ